MIYHARLKYSDTSRGQVVKDNCDSASTTTTTKTRGSTTTKKARNDGNSSVMSKLMWIGIGTHMIRVFFQMNVF